MTDKKASTFGIVKELLKLQTCSEKSNCSRAATDIGYCCDRHPAKQLLHLARRDHIRSVPLDYVITLELGKSCVKTCELLFPSYLTCP